MAHKIDNNCKAKNLYVSILYIAKLLNTESYLISNFWGDHTLAHRHIDASIKIHYATIKCMYAFTYGSVDFIYISWSLLHISQHISFTWNFFPSLWFFWLYTILYYLVERIFYYCYMTCIDSIHKSKVIFAANIKMISPKFE